MKVKPKKSRGRPATGKDPVVGLRMSPNLRGEIVKWAENQPDKPTLSEATRRLVELGLTVRARSKQASRDRSRKAHAMAGRQIDQMADQSASPEDQATQKKGLLKGPEEFCASRVDHMKTK